MGILPTFLQNLPSRALPNHRALNIRVRPACTQPRRQMHRERQQRLVPARPDAELAVAAVNGGRTAADGRVRAGVEEGKRVEAALECRARVRVYERRKACLRWRGRAPRGAAGCIVFCGCSRGHRLVPVRDEERAVGTVRTAVPQLFRTPAERGGGGIGFCGEERVPPIGRVLAAVERLVVHFVDDRADRQVSVQSRILINRRTRLGGTRVRDSSH